MRVRYICEPHGNAAQFEIEAEDNLDRQCLLNLSDQFAVTSIRSQTGSRDLLECRRVLRERINVNPRTKTS